MPPTITRLAPSPTGAFHLGNARTFLVNWLLARQNGWRVLLRVEDLDGPRVKADAAEQMLDELRWLGLSWSGQTVRQSDRAAVYGAALEELVAAGQAYPCTCSRKDVERAASAPHADDGAAIYNGACRRNLGMCRPEDVSAGGGPGSPAGAAWRVLVPEGPVAFRDEFAGPQSFDLSRTCGDFVVHRGEGLAAYQLAVVIDDAASGVDAIVRGDDLMESAARQIHLRRLLGLSPEPRYWHLPLVVGPDGRRLAKRHGDTRLAAYRAAGATAERVLGLLGFWCGAIDRRRPAAMEELIDRFDLSRMPRGPVVFSPEDDAYLRGKV